jgi:hypothetical protein
VEVEGRSRWMRMLKGIPVVFVAFALSVTLFKTSFCDDFPSLLTANASIAIILDREYLDNKYDDTLKEIKVKRLKVLRHSSENFIL